MSNGVIVNLDRAFDVPSLLLAHREGGRRGGVSKCGNRGKWVVITTLEPHPIPKFGKCERPVRLNAATSTEFGLQSGRRFLGVHAGEPVACEDLSRRWA